MKRFSPSALAFASLVFSLPLAGQAAEPPPPVKGKCFACHGLDGISADPAIPRLAGLQAAYIVRQLKNFVEGRRRNEDMAPMAADLSDDAQQVVAEWYASQKPVAGKAGDAALSEAGRQIYEEGNGDPAVQPCVTCHQPDGGGNARFPRLAGQSKTYLQKQLEDFKAGRRATEPQMAGIARPLSSKEIRALVEYVGAL